MKQYLAVFVLILIKISYSQELNNSNTLIKNLEGFKCSDQTKLEYAIRLSSTGNIECFSLDGKNCSKVPLQKDQCKNYIQKNIHKVQPISCGKQMREKIGNTGYNIKNHWCRKGYNWYFKTWHCEPETGINTAIKINPKSFNVECISKNGRDCVWGELASKICSKANSCRKFRSNIHSLNLLMSNEKLVLNANNNNSNENTKIIETLTTFACGSQHESVFGHNGYFFPHEHWCKQGYAFFRYTGQFTCKERSNLNMPVRIDSNGFIQCLTRDGKNCISDADTEEKCQALVVQATDNGRVEPNTISCGSHLRKLTGFTGFENENHWCRKAFNVLFKFTNDLKKIKKAREVRKNIRKIYKINGGRLPKAFINRIRSQKYKRITEKSENKRLITKKQILKKPWMKKIMKIIKTYGANSPKATIYIKRILIKNKIKNPTKIVDSIKKNPKNLKGLVNIIRINLPVRKRLITKKQILKKPWMKKIMKIIKTYGANSPKATVYIKRILIKNKIKNPTKIVDSIKKNPKNLKGLVNIIRINLPVKRTNSYKNNSDKTKHKKSIRSIIKLIKKLNKKGLSKKPEGLKKIKALLSKHKVSNIPKLMKIIKSDQKNLGKIISTLKNNIKKTETNNKKSKSKKIIKIPVKISLKKLGKKRWINEIKNIIATEIYQTGKGYSKILKILNSKKIKNPKRIINMLINNSKKSEAKKRLEKKSQISKSPDKQPKAKASLFNKLLKQIHKSLPKKIKTVDLKKLKDMRRKIIQENKKKIQILKRKVNSIKKVLNKKIQRNAENWNKVRKHLIKNKVKGEAKFWQKIKGLFLKKKPIKKIVKVIKINIKKNLKIKKDLLIKSKVKKHLKKVVPSMKKVLKKIKNFLKNKSNRDAKQFDKVKAFLIKHGITGGNKFWRSLKNKIAKGKSIKSIISKIKNNIKIRNYLISKKGAKKLFLMSLKNVSESKNKRTQAGLEKMKNYLNTNRINLNKKDNKKIEKYYIKGKSSKRIKNIVKKNIKGKKFELKSIIGKDGKLRKFMLYSEKNSIKMNGKKGERKNTSGSKNNKKNNKTELNSRTSKDIKGKKGERKNTSGSKNNKKNNKTELNSRTSKDIKGKKGERNINIRYYLDSDETRNQFIKNIEGSFNKKKFSLNSLSDDEIKRISATISDKKNLRLNNKIYLRNHMISEKENRYKLDSEKENIYKLDSEKENRYKLDSENERIKLDSENERYKLDSENERYKLDSENERYQLNSENGSSKLNREIGRNKEKSVKKRITKNSLKRRNKIDSEKGKFKLDSEKGQNSNNKRIKLDSENGKNRLDSGKKYRLKLDSDKGRNNLVSGKKDRLKLDSEKAKYKLHSGKKDRFKLESVNGKLTKKDSKKIKNKRVKQSKLGRKALLSEKKRKTVLNSDKSRYKLDSDFIRKNKLRMVKKNHKRYLLRNGKDGKLRRYLLTSLPSLKRNVKKFMLKSESGRIYTLTSGKENGKKYLLVSSGKGTIRKYILISDKNGDRRYMKV